MTTTLNLHGRLFLAPLAALVVMAAPAGARAAADPQETVAQVTQLNRDAIALYQKKRFDEARRVLKKALELCDVAGLDHHPVAARTHIHLGIVIVSGFGQPEIGIKQFSAALEIQPDITLTPGLGTPAAQQAFDEAASQAAGGPAQTSAADQPAPAPQSGGLAHIPIARATAGQPITIAVQIDADLRFARLVLAYRADGDGEFLGRPMTPTADGVYEAEIPASATTGGAVSYYVEAQNDAGEPIAAKASASRPYVIALRGASRAGAPAVARPLDPDDRVEARRASNAQSDGDEEGPVGSPYQFGLLVGAEAGWASGAGDVNADNRVGPAFASSKLGHLTAEAGYWVQPAWMVSLQGRFQYITGPTVIEANGRTYHPANGATAVFAAATWSPGSGRLRPFASVAAGLGRIRHVVTFSALHDCGPSRTEVCVDTVGGGPVLAGVGGGLSWDLGQRLALVGAVSSQVGAPTFTFNLDLNLGLSFRL